MFLYIAIAVLVPIVIFAAVVEFERALNKDDEDVIW